MLTETIIEDDRWKTADVASLAESAAQATLSHLGLDPARFEIAVLCCDDARIATLNADFRDKPQPTNVLSWPETDLSTQRDGDRPAPPDGQGDVPTALGDIAIAYDTCAREALAQGKAFDAHVTHLLVHATLHLLGYDHLRDADATLMERREVEILGKLGLADPYRD